MSLTIEGKAVTHDITMTTVIEEPSTCLPVQSAGSCDVETSTN